MKEKKKKKKAGSTTRAILIAIIVLLSLMLALILAAVIFVNSTLNQIARPGTELETLSQEELDAILNETDPEDPEFTGPVLAPEDVTMPTAPAQVAVEDSEEIINILLVGQDTYSLTQRSRSDSMILCTINKSAKTLTMTSFMRDLYVTIPEYYDHRLNTAYAVGGFPALYDSLEYNFGVSVNKGVAVNFKSFKQIVDAVGGVDVNLTYSEAAHLNKNGWSLSSGVNHLDGTQALAYSRIRKIDSDFNRTSRQRNVMYAIIDKAKRMSLTELYDLLDVLIPMVYTDMSNKQILSTAAELAPMLQDMTIITQRIPVDNGYYNASVKGMAVLIPDIEMNCSFLADTIGVTADMEAILATADEE